MGIFDRLGDVLKSYLNGEDARIFGGGTGRTGDADYDAAMDELDEMLGKEKHNDASGASSSSGASSTSSGASSRRAMPQEVAAAFAELGLAPSATFDECKAAYKKLLKIHHPDRHAGHAGNLKKATEKTSRLNAAFDKIEKWFA
jgi:DnaJ-domain-containing protein 1